ncbi:MULTISPECIES: fumarate/nitrate reduction transcriptional regulator Fnr [Spiribacter]|nr:MULTISPECIES: fumarate/nitrate reduction transcriptional regulator Fnr [Spiribacter]
MEMRDRVDPSGSCRTKTCSRCSLSRICLPVSLDEADIGTLGRLIEHQPTLRRGEALFNEGDGFRALYAVRAGSLKSFTTTASGEQQVTGFHLPGELVALNAINRWEHPGSAVALETTSVCELPFEKLEDLAADIPDLQRQLLRLMSQEIADDQDMLFTMARRNADERLAILLLSFSERFRQRGLSGTRFRLSMARSDLGNYLGLAPETMSRVFRRFQDQGWIRAEGREVELLSVEALAELAA